MRTLALVVLAAACGGSSKTPPPKAPAPAPEVGTTIKVNAERPSDAMPRADKKLDEPPPPAPPPAPKLTTFELLDRVHDKAGGVPGMPGWRLKRVEDKTVCGGTRIAIDRGKQKLDADQMQLAKIYALSFPTDLSFDPANKEKKDASLKRFNEFVESVTKTGADVNKYFMTGIDGGDAASKAARAARLAQVSLQVASLLARAPIPKDIRSGDMATEKTDAYCSRMEEVAEPLAMRGREAIGACAKAPADWYAELCATAPE